MGVLPTQRREPVVDELRCKIEVRETEGRPTRLVGTLLRYTEVARDRREAFEPGALKWDASGLILNRQHDRQRPILKFKPDEVDGCVVVDVEVPSTVAGIDAVAEIRQGLFTGLSIEFKSIRERFEGGIRKISEALLVAAAIVDSPSYPSSMIEARAKAAKAARDRDEWSCWRQEVET